MKVLKLLGIFILAIVITGCDNNIYSFETVEAQRHTAIDNSGFNAQIYRNAYYPQLLIKARGDSTISEKCAQGDGWATIDLLEPKTGVLQVELKCSTYSDAIACLSTPDFQKRYTDGKCDDTIPVPIPHVVK